MTLIACADCDTVLFEVPEGIDPDNIDIPNCRWCKYDD